MGPREFEAELDVAFETGDNIYVVGKPGIGKTEIPEQYCKERNLGFKRIVLPQYEEVDLRGIPEVNERKRTVFYPTEELPYADIHGEKGILLIDEHPSAKPSVQIITHQLLDSRKLGSLYTLPPGWIMVLTGNLAEDYTFVFEMPTTVRSRCAMHTLEPDFKAWKVWAIEHGVAPEIIAYLNTNYGSDFIFFKPEVPAINYALPRTWVRLSKYLEALRKRGSRIGLEGINARIGEAVGSKFHKWHTIASEVPDIDGILEGKSTRVPSNLSIQWCVASMVMSKTVTLEKAGCIPSVKNVLKYVNLLSSDVVACFLIDLMTTKFWAETSKKIVKLDEWCDLAAKHEKVMVGAV